MRGKKAKELRRIAEETTVGQPMVAYNFVTQNKSYEGLDGVKRYFQMHRVSMKKKCTRRFYKFMKKQYMVAQRAGAHA